jgi:leucyl aminopeptidase
MAFPGVEADRVLLVGLGKEKEFREKEYRSAIATAVRQLNETGGFDGTVFLTELARKRSATCRLEDPASHARGRRPCIASIASSRKRRKCVADLAQT